MSTPTAEAVRGGLRNVVDPCSIQMGVPLDIWEMGLVEDVDVTDGRVRVTLVLTDLSCVFYRDMRRNIVDELLDVPGVKTVEVRLATDVLWTPDRMRTGEAVGRGGPA